MIGVFVHHAVHAVLAALAAHVGGIHFADGFLGVGGSSSGTDRKAQLGGYGDLSNIYNTGITGGTDATSKAAGYNSKILSGDRSSIMSALSPEIGAITGLANQNKKQQASMGTARGGGTDALNQQQQQNTQAEVSNTINTARPEAAKSEAGLGTSLLGTANSAAGTLTGDAINSYKTTSAQNAATGAAAGKLASTLIMGA